VPPEAPYPAGSSGRVNGTRGQLTKMTRGFTPCGSSMAATAPVVACWPEFSLDRYTYDGGWDIYAAGPPLRLGRFSPRNRPRSVPLAPRQGDLRHVDIATVEDTLGPVHWDVDNCPVAQTLVSLTDTSSPAK
jgi:hypothetical protein